MRAWNIQCRAFGLVVGVAVNGLLLLGYDPVWAAEKALLGPHYALLLPSPADLGRKVETTQLLTAKYKDDQYTFEGRLSISPERLVLAGVDGMGRRAMTVTWDGHDMTVERAPWLPESLRPASILADIVVLYWPEKAVRRTLAPAGCALIATPKSRRVRCGSAEVLRAKFDWATNAQWTGTVQYSNLAWGYEIGIQSQELDP